MQDTTQMLQLTDKALDKIKKLIAAEGKENIGLRVGVKAGGCSGLSYQVAFEEKPLENDTVLEFDGVKVFVDVFSSMYLKGTVLDYTDGLDGAGFVFQNPNATRSCGCGQSFSA